tara:strand:+ start:655 stop:825 length:171 start_codon:yes stop_codon:yes gene_type:complete
MQTYDDFSTAHSALLNEMKSNNKDDDTKETKLRERRVAILNTLMVNILKLKNLSEK